MCKSDLQIAPARYFQEQPSHHPDKYIMLGRWYWKQPSPEWIDGLVMRRTRGGKYQCIYGKSYDELAELVRLRHRLWQTMSQRERKKNKWYLEWFEKHKEVVVAELI